MSLIVHRDSASLHVFFLKRELSSQRQVLGSRCELAHGTCPFSFTHLFKVAHNNLCARLGLECRRESLLEEISHGRPPWRGQAVCNRDRRRTFPPTPSDDADTVSRHVWLTRSEFSWHEAAGPPRRRGGKVRPTKD